MILSGTTPRYPQPPLDDDPPRLARSGQTLHMPPVPPPRRRRRVALLAAGGGLLAVLLALPFVAAWVVRAVVLPQVSERVGCPVTATSVRVWPGRIILRGLHVRGAPGPSSPELAIVPEAIVRFDLLPLLIGRVQLREVLLDRPALQIVRGDPEDDNVTPLLSRRKNQGAATTSSSSAK